MNHIRFDNESMSLLEQLRDLHEGFMVALCQVLGLVYEEAITVDVVNAVKALKAERENYRNEALAARKVLEEMKGRITFRHAHVEEETNRLYQEYLAARVPDEQITP